MPGKPYPTMYLIHSREEPREVALFALVCLIRASMLKATYQPNLDIMTVQPLVPRDYYLGPVGPPGPSTTQLEINCGR